MKNKLVSLIKDFLMKTWLPIKEKKEEIAGKIKFSIIKKISFGYLKNLLIGGVVLFCIMQLLYIMLLRDSYNKAAEKIITSLNNIKTEAELDEYFQGLDYNKFEETIYITFKKSDADIIKFETLPKNININQKRLIAGIAYLGDIKEDNFELIIIQKYDIENITGNYNLTLYYDMTKYYIIMQKLMWYMIICYIFVIIFVIYEGKKESARLFIPIREMSEAAGRLTVNNLGSERLNVEGTKDELKELAIVINDMLDRMDISYESQKQFVSDASHELRTPIAVVQGYVNMLDRWGAKDPEVLSESITALKNEASSMQDLIEKLLFLSRHDKKTLKLQKKRFCASSLIEEIYKETKMVVKDREVLCPVLEKAYIYGDKQSIKQAVRVFIDNAVKYSEKGDKISLSCINHKGDCIIEIADTGIGMKKRDLDNIFNRFYRADDVRNKKIDGHGLGLSIAKLIITAHAGRIKVKTQYTKGTSFKLTFPKLWYASENYYDTK